MSKKRGKFWLAKPHAAVSVRIKSSSQSAAERDNDNTIDQASEEAIRKIEGDGR